jgi:hypothetical protein
MGHTARESFADVEWANLSFSDCDFSGSRFERAMLDGAVFTRCKFPGANFTDANLSGAQFLGNCNLEGATLIGIEAPDARFVGANLNNCDAKSAFFLGADFQGTSLADAHFESADLRSAKNLRLDGTFIQNAQFSPHADDDWSRLRRIYTGPRFLLNLLFPAIFIISLTARTYGWWAIALLQQAGLPADQANFCLSAGAAGCEEVALWELVTGWHAGLWAGLFASLSLLYNAARLMVTLMIAQMRDAEERSGRSPPLDGKIEPRWILWKSTFEPGYRVFPKIDFALRWFQRATFALAVLGWWELLGTTLVVPRAG